MTTTAINTNTTTEAPSADDHDEHVDDNDVEVGGLSSIASGVDAPATARRYQQSRISKFLVKLTVSGGNASAAATAPSSLVPSELVAPEREHGLGLGDFQGKFSSGTTPDQDVSRPGAFRVGVEAGSSNAPNRERGFGMDEYNRKFAGQTASATAPSSSFPSDAPATRLQRKGMDEYQSNFSTGANATGSPDKKERHKKDRKEKHSTENETLGEKERKKKGKKRETMEKILTDTETLKEKERHTKDKKEKHSTENGTREEKERRKKERKEKHSTETETRDEKKERRKKDKKAKNSTKSETLEEKKRSKKGKQKETKEKHSSEAETPEEKKRRKEKNNTTMNTEISHDLEVGQMPVGYTTEVSSTSATDACHEVFEMGGSSHRHPLAPSITDGVPPRRERGSGMDVIHRRCSGKIASAPSSVANGVNPSDVPPRRERGSRPGAFHVGVEAGSSNAPSRERGFGMDEYNRKRAGETASAMAPSSLVPSNVPTRRQGRSNMDEYQRKCAREAAPATAPSSSAPPVAPRRERGFGMDEYNRKCAGETAPTAATSEDQQEEHVDSNEFPQEMKVAAVSQPGAFRVTEDEISDSFSLTQTSDPFSVTRSAALPPAVPEIHQYQENTQGAYLAEANLVVEPDLVFGEPLEEPQAYWSQPKVRRRALFVFLLVLGMVVSVGVGVGVRVGMQRSGSTSEPPIFDCSNTTVGCLYTGTQSLGFQDPDSFLVANCTDTNFEIPTNENCDCEVNVPISPFGNPELCRSCSFVATAGGGWQIAYDCSNLLSGDCVGRDTSNNCIVFPLPFETRSELHDAVDAYLDDNSMDTDVARTYGWPIGIWNVSRIEDFSATFKASDVGSGPNFRRERFNPAAATFNEDISDWDVSSATTMRSMFHFATSFDQPLADWNVMSLLDVRFMFYNAASFNQPITDWNVSSVTSTHGLFHAATSFNQPLADWNLSSVTTMIRMFDGASAFDQPLADWNVKRVKSMSNMFNGATAFNQPLADWNVWRVTDMGQMFYGATSFNQPIGNWNVSSETDLTNIFGNSGCPGAEGEESCFYVI
jgi:hypothetical protein